MKNKSLFITFFSAITLFYVIPLLLINFSSTDNLNKYAFIIMLLVGFSAFAINLLYIYFVDKKITIPLIVTALSIPLIFIFNSSAFVLIIIIGLFSFFGYFAGSLIK